VNTANAQISQPRYNDIRNIPQRTGSSDVVTKPSAPRKEASKGTPQVSGKDLPGISTSKIDVNAKPIYEPAGKPITQVNIDEGTLYQDSAIHIF
jgi:pre-mRNA 3'-end-processing factor FIP1